MGEDGFDDDFDDAAPSEQEEAEFRDGSCAAVYSFNTIKLRLERIEHDKLHPPGSEFDELSD